MNQQEQLQAIVTESSLAETEANALIGDFTEAVRVAAEWEEKAKTLIVTDETQVELMAEARSARLELKEKRVAVTNKHKELKAASLRRGQALDKIKRFVLGLIEPTEKLLDAQEHFVELKLKAEEEERAAKAEALLREQEEAERKAKEEAAAEEQRKLREENERLRKEAEEKEAARQAELQLIAEENAKKVAAAKKEADEKAAVAAAEAAERERVERERVAEENEKREAAHKEAMRKAREITCPNCGHTFENKGSE